MSELDRRPVAVVGMGELGTLFSGALLKSGVPIVPVLRGQQVEHDLDPRLVLVAVGERDLDLALSAIPERHRNRIALLQNELLPEDWERHQIGSPTVAVVWFEQKPGQATKVIAPSPIAGPYASLLVSALRRVRIPAIEIELDVLGAELVRKNLYIVGSNLAGLRVGGTTGELATRHREYAREVLREVFAIECARLGQKLPEAPMLEQALRDLMLDPEHKCRGRTAPERLARALDRAQRFGLAVPTLRALESL